MIRLDVPEVRLPPLAGGGEELWRLLLDLAERLRVPWTLVGGQMVLLHGLQRDRIPPRVSADLDAVIDIRTDPRALHTTDAVFRELGLEAAGAPSPDGLMHRYVRPGTPLAVDVAATASSVDVLIPEGLSPSTDTTMSLGGRAFAAPGATQALSRTEYLPICYEDRRAWVPRPNLLAAIVVKAVAAVEDSINPGRHVQDLAFLCTLVEDLFTLRDDLTPKDRKRLRHVGGRLTPDSPVWDIFGTAAADGRRVWRAITST
ncbi:MAG: hypothetical protein H0T78_04070 [Longispora sp.]|nr:hypothetical protein [Longispora sp. (in: high G+C Gram-positive bacteria)]